MKKPNFINEKEVFAINPDLEASVHVIGPEEIRIVVLENFYKNPDLVRDLALTIPPTENSKILAGSPGTRVFGHYNFSNMYPIFHHIFRNVYGDITNDITDEEIKTSISTTPFCVNISQSNKMPPVVPHIDDENRMLFAGALYLNTPEECSGGTSFYMLKGKQKVTNKEIGNWLLETNNGNFHTHYLTDSEKDWDLLSVAEMKYNRLVIYPGNVLHTAYVKPEMFTEDKYRLVQMFFMPLRPNE